MKKNIILIILIITIPLISIFTQSNDELDRFFNQEKADLVTSAWLIYLSAGSLPNDADLQEAFDLLNNSEQAKRFTDKQENSFITFGEFACLLMDVHNLPGGLLYRIFKSPRYAAREMIHKRWIPGDPNPHTELTPWEVTTTISNILTWKEEQR